ncbi:uncharacterized protein DUF4214 [Pseudoduganella flava]|uniref:DUF4214 domain-containing protein n=1 Tax=Pseudoduganella flava TaxID=871742 RepID=A0A562PWC2_9BURK|nr:DUF4214 domain-containing protein [Pseudoduganella flava]QGZ39496.1 DUF4214 domain-containing protein [Pseudoduganella flava]TWI48386.1 uncharacterized protein DUF4214 [Pseudoduganella flava]
MADTPLLLGGTSANDVLTGGTADDVLLGQGGADRLIGGDGNDKLNSGEYVTTGGPVLDGIGDLLDGGNGDDMLAGGSGNDTLIGGAGDDTLSGGGGLDTAVYGVNRDVYTVAKGNGAIGLTAIGGSETDLLIGVERIQFADTALAFDIDGNAGQVYRLYQAVFDRQPDLPGIGHWLSIREDRGWSMRDIASAFLHSDEFNRMYGNADDAQFLTALYRNALHREPDQPGLQSWLTAISLGLSREEILLGFSESAENQAQVIGSIQNGIEYHPVG